MDYDLRQAVTADKEQIYALFVQSVRPYVEPIWGWDDDCQRKDFDASFVPGQFHVIEVQGQFAGFIQVAVHNRVTELCEIHLAPAWRGRSIGSGVIRRLLTGTVRTGCFKGNTRARELYTSLGFRQIGETETHFLLEYRDHVLNSIGG